MRGPGRSLDVAGLEALDRIDLLEQRDVARVLGIAAQAHQDGGPVIDQIGPLRSQPEGAVEIGERGGRIRLAQQGRPLLVEIGRFAHRERAVAGGKGVGARLEVPEHAATIRIGVPGEQAQLRVLRRAGRLAGERTHLGVVATPSWLERKHERHPDLKTFGTCDQPPVEQLALELGRRAVRLRDADQRAVDRDEGGVAR